ncbi:arylamine N-acetyltransferase [Kribbella sancticallisti]|uniref:Arylamine N-acetyltransferase n=1 Tax=Kribbella sancticallisti TaxID=460087 RepID=A0ABP4QCQ7_9ACTN
MDSTALLRRIGIDQHRGPSVEALFELHAAFADTVPYETIQYQFGQGGSMDPQVVAPRIIARETGGYCFQLNGTFAQLLTELGYQVELHRGGVQTATRPAVVDASHMVITVSGLPDAPDEEWLVDVGLGDGLFTPLPLKPGTTRQEPFDLTLRPSEIVDGWRLDHDPRSSLTGMDFESATVSIDAFAAQHAHLSVSPESPFVRTSSAYRRKPDSMVMLRSLGLMETFADRVDNRIVETSSEYFTVLADVFHLPLDHLTAAQHDELWKRAVAQYEAWLAR